jgi:hypothetical protein
LLFFNSAVDHDPMRNPSSPARALSSVLAPAARVALLLAGMGLAACTSEASSSLSIASSAPATEPTPSDPGEMTGSPRSPITITETGQPLAGGSVWTASFAGRRSGDACEDATGESWASTTTASPAVTGFPTTTIQWTFAAPAACAATAHLYCFEQ